MATTHQVAAIAITISFGPDTPNEEMERIADAVMEHLLEVPRVMDPSIMSDLSARTLEIEVLVPDSPTLEDASAVATAVIRTALHAAGCVLATEQAPRAELIDA